MSTESLFESRDTILDFGGGKDKLDFSAFDANTVASGQQHFGFIGNAASFSAAGQPRYAYDAGTKVCILFGDIDNNMTVDFVIDLANFNMLTASDFIL